MSEAENKPTENPAGIYWTPEWHAARYARQTEKWRPEFTLASYEAVLLDLRQRRDELDRVIAAIEAIAPKPKPGGNNADAPTLPRTLVATEPQSGAA